MINLKKVIDGLFKFNKSKTSIFNLIIVLVGLAFGTIFIKLISTSDQSLVVNQIKDFFNNCNENLLDLTNIFKNSLFSNILYLLVIWIFGISIIGIPIIVFLLFFKGFTLGFSIGGIFYTYGFKGLLGALIYIFPHQIINLIVLLFICNYALFLSISLLKALLKKQNINFKSFIGKYLLLLVISIVILVVMSVYETFLMPKLIKLIYSILV